MRLHRSALHPWVKNGGRQSDGRRCSDQDCDIHCTRPEGTVSLRRISYAVSGFHDCPGSDRPGLSRIGHGNSRAPVLMG
ncbi:hypothetical protein [Streptomyces sp. NPDC093261]|uniref:hypothetical protein n=1 Tax=Streptomyces sp. NPDC093261 TaxID=3366037 RepID=UPI00382427DB